MDKTKTRLLAVLFVVSTAIVAFFGGSHVMGSTENMMMSAVIEPSLTVAISSNSPVLNVEPSATGQFGNANFDVEVYTNNSAGYTLTMTPSNVNLSLSGGEAGDVIEPLGSGFFTENNFTVNRWGISIDGGDYQGIASGGTVLINANQMTGNTPDEVNIDYGAKLNLLTKSGTYSTTVNFVALAKTGVLYMQDVGTWGSTLAVGDEIEATDSRDGKVYYVAKLADGNIWMTQNLDHDIVLVPNYYTYYNTDIGHGSTTNTYARWTGTATYTTNILTWNPNGQFSGPESYDPGNLCWNGLYSRDGDSFGGFFSECGGGDRHYHIGNYYNGIAAAAMDEVVISTNNVGQSICPAGWVLPSPTEFEGLMTAEELTAGSSGNMHLAPAYFVYGGMWGGGAIGVAQSGRYETPRRDARGISYTMFFEENGSIDFNSRDVEDYGHSVRCVAHSGAQ